MTPTETTTILRQFNTCVKPRRPMRTAKPISSPFAGRPALAARRLFFGDST